MISIEVRGADRIAARLRAFNMGMLRPAMVQSVLLLEGAMKKYPSPPSGSGYRRTGRLGRGWTHDVSSSGNVLIGKVGNNTSYGPFVQSQAFQARIHRGRWLTDENALKQNITTITRFFENRIESVLG